MPANGLLAKLELSIRESLNAAYLELAARGSPIAANTTGQQRVHYKRACLELAARGSPIAANTTGQQRVHYKDQLGVSARGSPIAANTTGQ